MSKEIMGQTKRDTRSSICSFGWFHIASFYAFCFLSASQSVKYSLL